MGTAARRRLQGIRCGLRVTIQTGVYIYHPDKLKIGDDSAIAVECLINASGEVQIGRDVLIGPGTKIWSQNHRFSSARDPIRCQGYDYASVSIEDDVWIGMGATILPGVNLGRGTVVAAGAVVTHSTEPFSVVAGVPARRIGCREGEGSHLLTVSDIGTGKDD